MALLTSLPKGTHDIFPPEIDKWQYVESQIRSFYRRFLYKEVRTPIFEHSELFLRGIGGETDVVQKEMYTFKDKGDRSLTLRPENTASVVRAAIENNFFDSQYPLKFYYIGPMFRFDKPQQGRFRQFHQFGVEVFADETPFIDAEVIYSAVAFLRVLGIAEITLKINSVGCKECRPEYIKTLRATAGEHAADLCGDCQRKVATNPLRIFDCKNARCIEISQQFPAIAAHLCSDCHSHFQEVLGALQRFGVDYQRDDRLVRGLDYYTKTTFEITSGKLGAQNALLGGGRYNDLIRELGGPDMPGIGFAAGMERLLLHVGELAMAADGSLAVIYQKAEFLPQAMALAQELWQQGYAVMLDYHGQNIKKQFKKADRCGARFALILGEDEVASERVSIKNMSNQEQVNLMRKEVQPWLQQHL